MMNLDIKINIKRLSLYSRSSKSYIDDDTMLRLIEDFSYYIKSLYLKLIYEGIYSNRYRGKWEPTDEIGYLEYIDTTPTEHIYDLISDSLEVVKVGANYVVRVKPHYKYPKSSRNLSVVLRAIDNGTTKFNARPLFYRCINKITLHMYELWKGFLSMRGVI